MPTKSSIHTKKMILLYTLIILFFILIALPGCNSPEAPSEDGDPGQQDGKAAEAAATETSAAGELDQNGNTGTGERENQVQEQENTAADDPLLWEGKFSPNELGEIMILMYHEIGHPEGEWQRTPDNFRRDLETLYVEGYRLVSLNDVVRGEIDIPAGTSPVVLTFDDANRGNFNYLEQNGTMALDPDCAVAILEDFYAENPDFGLAATFYIYYPNPFRQPALIEEKLNYLVDKGFDIGNHTYGHANLSRISPTEIQRELALHQKHTEQYIPGYKVRSLALPYGASPREHAGLLLEGSYEGTSYSNEAVLLVGANPAPSPFHHNFNPARLPRIRASEMNTAGVGMYDWLDVFEANPQRRYVSDGNPNTIAVPESRLDSLDKGRTHNKEIIIILEQQESEDRSQKLE